MAVTSPSFFQVAPPSDPSVQNVKSLSCSSFAKKVKNPVTAPASAFMAIPAKSIVDTSEFPLLMDIKNTSAVVKSAPKNANTDKPTSPIKGIENRRPPPKTMNNAAAMALPPDIPIIEGSAKGFLNKPCIAAPVTAKLPPMTRAKSTLGNRMCQKTKYSSVVCSQISIPIGCRKAEMVLLTLMSTAPSPEDKNNEMNTPISSNRIICCCFLFIGIAVLSV